MGSRKSKLEGTKETGKEIGGRAIETGEKIVGEGTEIDRILGSIDLDLDEDDIRAIENAKRGYGQDFGEAFEEQVEEVGKQAGEKLQEVKAEADVEKGRVQTAAGQMEQAGGVSEIGRRNAEAGKSSLEKSAEFYEEIGTEALREDEKIKSEISRSLGSLERLF